MAVMHGFVLGFTRVDLGLLLGLDCCQNAGFLGLLGLIPTLLLSFFNAHNDALKSPVNAPM